MEHAILGAGGVGGLVAGVLAQAGEPVTLVVRPEATADYPEKLCLQRPATGEQEFAMAHTALLDHPVDVLWITVKATQLGAALQQVPGAPAATVIPLLNGIDHVALLRSRYGTDKV